MKYPEEKIAEHLDGASASLEMVIQELEKMSHPYYEKMTRDISIAQQKIDNYLSDFRDLAKID